VHAVSVPLERVSLTDRVVGELREEILGGDLEPGTSLREVALAERFDVGRSTVREAIRVLAAEGLVSQAHHRGAVVTAHTPEDVDDLIAARTMIERHVASAGVPDPSPARAALDAMRAAVEAADWRAAASADEAFHRALVAGAGSPRITAIHAQLAAELRLLLVSADRQAPEQDKVAEHERLLALAVAGDADAYLEAAIRHIRRSRETLLAVARRRR
jgi:DNA-binding GntR family transcriptional regulator